MSRVIAFGVNIIDGEVAPIQRTIAARLENDAEASLASIQCVKKIENLGVFNRYDGYRNDTTAALSILKHSPRLVRLDRTTESPLFKDYRQTDAEEKQRWLALCINHYGRLLMELELASKQAIPAKSAASSPFEIPLALWPKVLERPCSPLRASNQVVQPSAIFYMLRNGPLLGKLTGSDRVAKETGAQ